MNEQIHEELTLLEKELSRLDTAVKDIETAKKISKNVIDAAENLSINFSMFYEKLNSSFIEIEGQHKNLLNEYSNKFNTELSDMVSIVKNEFDSANLLFNQNLDRFNSKIDEISNEYTTKLNQFDEKSNNIIDELNLLLKNNNELRDKISVLFKDLDELHLPLKFDKLDTTISSISQGIQNIQGRLDTLESNIIRATDTQRKKISDEMEMVTLGMNNINKSMESKFVSTDESFEKLKKENKILGLLLIIILIVVIIQFFIWPLWEVSMSKEIKISDHTLQRLFSHSKGFDENEEAVIKRLLNFYESHQGQKRERIITTNHEANENLGPRGNHQIEDYIIPVIHLIKGENLDKITAFKRLAKKLNVNYSTVSAECTRRLGFKHNNDFYERVINGKIYNYILGRYPNQADYIRRELGKYFT